MPERRFKPRERKSEVRDARLIIIATEGTKTEKKYFEDLAFDDRYRNSRVHVEVLERLSAGSSPGHVIEDLNQFASKYSLTEHDELWLVIDVDRWGIGALSDVATQCLQKNYLLAVSNPCFELWLLLHVTSLDNYTPADLEELKANRRRDHTGRTRLEKELLTLCGSYNKDNLATADYLPHVETAIERARALDVSENDRWPNQLGTRVYRLALSIITTSRR